MQLGAELSVQRILGFISVGIGRSVYVKGIPCFIFATVGRVVVIIYTEHPWIHILKDKEEGSSFVENIPKFMSASGEAGHF